MARAFFTPFDGTYETPVGRCARALLLGALTGAGVTSAPCLLLPPLALYVFPVALFWWLAGLLLVASPLWALSHLAGVRTRIAAILVGLIVTPAVFICWMRLPSGWRDPPGLLGLILPAAVLLALAGGLAANVVWRTAYRGQPAGEKADGDSHPDGPEDRHRR